MKAITDMEGGSRRSFLKAAAGTAAIASLGAMAERATASTAKEQILSLFDTLPGDKALKIFAPATKSKAEFSVEMNAGKQMFVGSAIKTFILAEALRQVDSPNIVQTLTAKQLTLDASVWNLDSQTFNPPNLIGQVSQRTALEAMIQHSEYGNRYVIEAGGPGECTAIDCVGAVKRYADTRKHARVFRVLTRG
jgi:beta-lactamase class A